MYTSAIDELLNLERGIQELFEFVPSRVAAAMPAINVVEAKDHYQISVELPGLVKDDVKISLDMNPNMSVGALDLCGASIFTPSNPTMTPSSTSWKKLPPKKFLIRKVYSCMLQPI